MLLLAASQAACTPLKHATEEFPLSVGFQPVEPVVASATWPAAVPGDPYPQGLGPIVAVSNFAHYGSHARGYLHAPLAKVYQALHDPAASYIHNQDGGTLLDRPDEIGVEPFPVSFLVHYLNNTKTGLGTITTRFDVTYRAGPLQEAGGVPVVIGERYQKTWGIEQIHVMEGSLVATAVDGAPDVTSVEMVAWLNAYSQGQADCDGTLSDLFGDLVTKLASMP
jgi:hypothetical protein